MTNLFHNKDMVNNIIEKVLDKIKSKAEIMSNSRI